MASDTWSKKTLIRELPDIPQWSLTRFLLLNDGAVSCDDHGAVVANPDRDFLSVVGMPSNETLAVAFKSAAEEATVLGHAGVAERIGRVSGVAGEYAHLHTLADRTPLMTVDPKVFCGPLVSRPEAYPDSDVVDEIAEAFDRHSEVSAVWVEGEPVSICYSVGESERYWDVSIDTVQVHRRKGYAVQAFLHHYALMQAQGLEPVWGAALSNPPSVRLAGKLGFTRVADIWEFTINDTD